VTICDQTFFLSTKKDQELLASLGVSAKGEKLSLAELLQRSEVDPVQTLTQFFKSSGLVIDQRVIRAAAISIKYRGYIKRNEVEQNKIRRLAKKSIIWSELLTDSNISFECKKRIEKIRPETFGQLQRIEGIRPATLSFVASHRL
jgi:tRNA uridine 5-carboxymethylaminomethyl modification enzyme